MPSDRLARFASRALSLDHPRGSALAAAAVAALVSAAPAQAGPAALAIVAATAPKASPAQPSRAANAYSALVREVQGAADRAFGAGAVVVLDRSAPSSTEFPRVAAASGHSQAQARALLREGAGTYGRGDGRMGCVVIGELPSATPADVFKAAGVAPGPSDVTWEDAQRWALTSALGQCQMKGALTSEQGYAFAALATVSASRSKDLPGLLARHVEIRHTVETASSERLGPVVASAARLGTVAPKGQPDYRALFATARAVALEREASDEPSPFLAGMGRVAAEASFYVPVREGAVATDLAGWIRAYAEVPGFSRAVRLLDDFASGRFADMPAVPAPTDGWEAAMRKAAAQGDPAAAVMVEAPKPTAEAAPAGPAPDRFASSVRGTLIPFDRDHRHISFEGDRFTVSDAEGNEIANGSHGKGIEEEVANGPRPR